MGTALRPLKRLLASSPAMASWCILLLAGSTMCGAEHAAFVPGRVLVKFRAEVSAVAAQAAISGIGAREEHAIASSAVRVLALGAGDDEARRAAELSRRPDVEFAELDRYAKITGSVDDPLFSSQWHLAKISAPAAWDTTVGSKAIIVAVLDTGTDSTHPDLAANIVAGWNFYDNNADTTDVYGHGTATAGAVGAVGNNAIGVASVAFGCRIMPIRIADPTGYATFSAAASAIHWAADHGARVANLSFVNMNNSSAVSDASLYFQQHGGVVVIAAGNDAATLVTSDNPYELLVSATDRDDVITSWSDRGPPIDVCAPGIDILCPSRGGGYGYYWGTSFSAPITAGVAALVISANPSLTGAQARAIVKDSADDLGDPGWDPLYGAGRVNAARAVSQALGSGTMPAITQQPSDGTVTEGQSASFSVVASGTALSYQWQKAAPGASVYSLLPGANAANLTTSATVLGDSGSHFRCAIASAGGTTLSNAALLTVVAAAPMITQQPADQTVAPGQSATFTVAASGSGLAFQWQKATAGNSTYAGISGANAASYTTPWAAGADNGATFRVVVSNGGGSTTSSSATLTVVSGDITPPVISSISAVNISSRAATITWATNEPADSQVEYGTTTSYGTWSSLDAALVTAHSLTLTGLEKRKTYHYRVLSRDAAGNLASSGDRTVTRIASGDNDLTFTTADDAAGGETRCGIGSGAALLALMMMGSRAAARKTRRASQTVGW